jgi:hypothetical protein
MRNSTESQEGKKASQIFEEQSKAKSKDCHEKLCGMDGLRFNRGFQADTFTPTYNQVIEAGFRRQAPKSRDDVFNEAHGYPYFLVNYEADNFIIEWDILTHELTISVCDVLIGKISFEKAKEIIEASEPQSSNTKQD